MAKKMGKGHGFKSWWVKNIFNRSGSATATGGMELHARHAFQQFQPTPLKFKTKLNPKRSLFEKS